MAPATPWQEISSKKRAEVASNIPSEWKLSQTILETINAKSTIDVRDVPRSCGLLTDKEVEITEHYDAVGLIEKLASRHFTALEVATAFCKRAAVAHQLVSRSSFERGRY